MRLRQLVPLRVRRPRASAARRVHLRRAGAGFGSGAPTTTSEDNRAIACLQENPKKPGTACNLRYEAYKWPTVAEFLEERHAASPT